MAIEVCGLVKTGTGRDPVAARRKPDHLLELVGNCHGELVPLRGVPVLTRLTQKEFVDFFTERLRSELSFRRHMLASRKHGLSEVPAQDLYARAVDLGPLTSRQERFPCQPLTRGG